MQIYIFHATVVFLESSACNQERVSMVVQILTELAHTLVCILRCCLAAIHKSGLQ